MTCAQKHVGILSVQRAAVHAWLALAAGSSPAASANGESALLIAAGVPAAVEAALSAHATNNALHADVRMGGRKQQSSFSRGLGGDRAGGFFRCWRRRGFRQRSIGLGLGIAGWPPG